MRRLLAVAVALAALTACTDSKDDTRDDAAGSDAAPFKPFTAPDAKFRASFPKTPERSDQQVPAGSQSLRLVLYTSEVDDESGYSVGWFQLAGAVPNDGANAFLEATRDGSVKAIEGKLVRSAFTTHLGLPAIEYTAGAPEGHFVKCLTLVKGRDVYVVQVVSESEDPPRYREFVDSFSITT